MPHKNDEFDFEEDEYNKLRLPEGKGRLAKLPKWKKNNEDFLEDQDNWTYSHLHSDMHELPPVSYSHHQYSDDVNQPDYDDEYNKLRLPKGKGLVPHVPKHHQHHFSNEEPLYSDSIENPNYTSFPPDPSYFENYGGRGVADEVIQKDLHYYPLDYEAGILFPEDYNDHSLYLDPATAGHSDTIPMHDYSYSDYHGLPYAHEYGHEYGLPHLGWSLP